MKIKSSFFYCCIVSLLLSIAILSCTNDDPGNVQNGEVEFGFDLKDISEKNFKSLDTDTITPVAIVFSIEDAVGSLVYDTEEVELYNINDSYISNSISLLDGDYSLVKFWVVDMDGNVIYASPLEGSDFAYLVNNPLPIEFAVNFDETIKLVPEVLSTVDVTPEDFGHISWFINMVETFDFLINVYVHNETNQNFELSDAILNVFAEGNSIYSDSISAITNQVTILDGFDYYTLEVRKEGFETYVDTISNEELKLYFSNEENGPLIITLRIEALQATDIKYGYLYNHHVIYDARAIVNPEIDSGAWRIANDSDWINLRDYAGGINEAPIKLKSIGNEYWNIANGTDEYGFNWRGAGWRNGNGGFQELKALGTIYSQTQWYLIYSDANYFYRYSHLSHEGAGRSIRLVRDATPEEKSTKTDGEECGYYAGNDGKIYKTVFIGANDIDNAKVWIKDNLAEILYSNGDEIPNVSDDIEWSNLTTGARCAHGNNEDNVLM